MLPKKIRDLKGVDPKYPWADYDADARETVRDRLEKAVANGYDMMARPDSISFDLTVLEPLFEDALPEEIVGFVVEWQVDQMLKDPAGWTTDLYAARGAAKRRKDFVRADQIRFALEKVGVDVLAWDRERKGAMR